MVLVLSALLGALSALAGHDLAAQSLRDQPLRLLSGTCPRCGTHRGWTRTECPVCGRFPRRELVVAVLGALVALAVANTIGLRWALLPYLGFVFLTLTLGLTDLDAFRIVDRLNLPGTAMLVIGLGVASVLDGDPAAFGRGALAGAAYVAGAAVMYLIARGGFGLGDVKLAGQLGMFTGFLSWRVLWWAVVATAVVGGIVALTVLVTGRGTAKTEIPYGPAMIVGAWIAVAFGAAVTST